MKKKLVAMLAAVAIALPLVAFEPQPESAAAEWMVDQAVTQKNWSTYCYNGTYMYLFIKNNSSVTHFVDSTHMWWKERYTNTIYHYTLTGDMWLAPGQQVYRKVYFGSNINWVDANFRVPWSESWTNKGYLAVTCA
jgi:hypothetical protein